MKPKKLKRSNPLKWAAWGTFIGLAVVVVQADYDASPAFIIGGFVGGAFAGAFFAGIIAVIRNLFIR